MTLVELGAALRVEREKRGLDMEDAANRLKISARLLRALEEGDETSLPPLAYTKGFIRSYASYVGLSAEEVSEALGALEAASEPVAPQNVYEPEMVLTPRRNLKPILAGLFMVCVVAVVLVAWQQGVFDFLSRQTRRLAQPAPLQSAESVDPGNLTSRPSAPAAPAQGQAPAQMSAQGSAQAPAVASQPQSAAAPAQGQTPAQTSGQSSGQTSEQASVQPTGQAAQPAAPGLPRCAALPQMYPLRGRLLQQLRRPPPLRPLPLRRAVKYQLAPTSLLSPPQKNAGYTPAPTRPTLASFRCIRAILLPLRSARAWS